METRIPVTLFWIAGIAATAFSIGGNSAIMGWILTLTRSLIGSAALARQRPARNKGRTMKGQAGGQ